MENSESLPLYERMGINNTLQRVMDPLILLLLFLVVGHRISTFNSYTFTCWLIAFLCESWFTFQWLTILVTKWSPAEPKTYPERLFNRMSEAELPLLDLFVTTADAALEPPLITVNTVLSLMALEYPAHKLACYVSDDGCSPLNFYALVEASKFAKLWVPFCKKYNLQITVPFRYFSAEPSSSNHKGFANFEQEWFKIKEEYENLSRKIEDATRKPIPCLFDGEFAAFSESDRKNHPTIIKVIWENKEGISDELPHLIYVSREKRPEHPHQYKAGAMNVLTRVSGLMTNAPFMLNVDCDMFVNNPKIALHAMCIFLDAKGRKDVAFVQCPQLFYGGFKDDPFGNQLVALSKYIICGMAGLQGPFYAGTNCFLRRKAIYGLPPDFVEIGEKRELSEKELVQKFGSSREVVRSVADALEGKYSANYGNPSSFLEAAIQVSACGYEFGTAWGKQVGWLYGSTSEDVLTGLEIHKKGWRSERCLPDPIGFAGCAPGDFPSAMTQQKRWAAGLLKIFFSKHCPILCTLFGKVQVSECFTYLWIIQWGQRSVFELGYAALSAHCLISNTNFLPQEGLGLWIPVALFVIYNAYTLAEYFAIGLSLAEWWNNQRMDRIKTMCAWFVGFMSCMFKVFGISEAVFEITQKETPTSGDNENVAKFTFNESPIFVVGTTILMVQMTALVIYFLGLQPLAHNGYGCGLGEVFCSTYLVVCFWPFFKGLFGKGKYGIPLSTICKSAGLAFLFVSLSISTVQA